MMQRTENATAGANTGGGNMGTRELPAQLGDVETVRRICGGMSARHLLRMADAGLAPWGCKCGGRRLWNLAEIDGWIQGGCKPVRSVRGSR